MKKINIPLPFLLIILSLYTYQSYAQAAAWAWANTSESSGGTQSYTVCNDAAGNVYTAGIYDSLMIFPGSTSLSCRGANDGFVAKYNAAGGLLWAVGFGGTADDQAYAICTDHDGYVYVTGFFSSDTFRAGSTILVNNYPGEYKSFLLKLDVTGYVMWARTTGGRSIAYGSTICTDQSGHVYIGGTYQGDTLSFGTGVIVTDSMPPISSSGGIFLTQYDTSGRAIWAQSINGNYSSYPAAIAADNGGNLYMTGDYMGAMAIGADTLTNAGRFDACLVKYSSSGALIWAKGFGGYQDDQPTGICISSGSIYVTGFFSSAILAFSPTEVVTDSGTYSRIFIAKFDESGNTIWARTPGGNGFSNSYGIASDGYGAVYIAGNVHKDTLLIGSSVVETAAAQIYVAKYDTSGSAKWATGVNCGYAGNYANGISSDGHGAVYIAGQFQDDSLVFGSTTLISPIHATMYIAKLADQNTGIADIGRSVSDIVIYPNPSTGLFHLCELQSGNTIEISDILGQKVSTSTANGSKIDINISDKEKGIYFYHIQNGSRIVQQGKIVKE